MGVQLPDRRSLAAYVAVFLVAAQVGFLARTSQGKRGWVKGRRNHRHDRLELTPPPVPALSPVPPISPVTLPPTPAATPPPTTPPPPAPPPPPPTAAAAQPKPVGVPPATPPPPIPPAAPPGSANWVILMTVNQGYYDFFLNWCVFFKALNLPYPVHVVPEDKKVLQTLAENPPSINITVHTYSRSFLDAEGQNAHQYDTGGFKSLVSQRGTHVAALLRKGLSVLYTDTDTVWLSDPFLHLKGSCDMWMQVDTESFNRQSPYYCTGLIASRAVPATLTIINEWERRLAKPQANQPVFNDVVHGVTGTKAGLKHCGLPRNLFPSGMMYFDRKHEITKRPVAFNPKDAVIVHNNYIQGHAAKLGRFKAHGLWKLPQSPAAAAAPDKAP